MASVFVSYAREDAPKAKAIASALEESALEVWFDERIHSGSEYSREIEEALARASAVLVLWSRNSIGSPWVRDEAAEGRDSGRLVSVLLDDCRPPIGFRQFQTTDLSHWSGRGSPAQIHDLASAVEAKTGAAPQTLARRVPTPWWRRPVASIAASLGVVVIAVAAFVAVTRMGIHRPLSPSVALLPFTADASDTDGRRLAPATRDAVAHMLSQGAFAVSTIDALQQNGKAPADFLISGQVTTTPDKVVTTVRMEEAAHHVVVFSHQFEAARDKAWELPERVGAQVASQLSWTASMIATEKRHPSDPAVLKALLQGGTAGLEGVTELQDFENAQRLATLAPSSPMAQTQLAFNTAFALDQIPRDERAHAVVAARQAAARAIELAPEYGGGYIPWCLLHSEVRRIECENRLRAGIRADPDQAFDNFFLALLVLYPAGRNDEALEFARASLAHDQYMPFKIGLMLRLLELSAATKDAETLYAQSSRWWPQNETIDWFRLIGMVQRGDFSAAGKFQAQTNAPGEASPVLAAITSKSLPAVRTACSPAKEVEAAVCMLGLASLGDVDAAYRLADTVFASRVGRTPAEEERIWLDRPAPVPVSFLTSAAAAPLRGDPRYVALAARLGLLSYWRSGRPPDFCRSNPEPICARLLPRR